MLCLGDLSLGVKRPGREADHSPPSSAEVKEWVELYLHSPNKPSWYCAQLKHRDTFTYCTNIVNIDQELMFSIQFKSFLIFLDLLNGTL
jgi:hypothetical protein